MACNCKKISENAGKYSDDGSGLEEVKYLGRIPIVLLRIILTILTVCLIIVILPFFLLWIIFRMVIGKDISINLRKLLKINEERKQQL